MYLLLTGLFVVPGVTGCRSTENSETQSVDAVRQAYDRGEFAQAEEQATKIVETEPDNFDARKILALALAAQGKNDEAIEQYVYVVDRRPDEDATLYQVAMLERVVGKTEDAISHLEAAVQLKADSSYMDDLARTYMQVGRYQEAADLWGRVLEDDSLDEASRVELLKLQAKAYEDGRMYDEARAALDKALFLAPNDEDLKKRIEALK